LPETPERWARRFRTRDFGSEIPDVLNGWWYRTCSGYLPNPVDEIMNIGSTRAFLFTGPEGTGKYTTAMLLASNLKDRGFSCYSLTGSDFDIWRGDRMTSALQAVAVGQRETDTGETEIEGRTVIIRYPEECRRFKRLQKALYSVCSYCKEMDLPLFLIVITQTPSWISSRLRKQLFPCVFRLPDEEERRRFIRNYYEGRGFRFDLNGNAAIEKERREKMVSDTDGFNYDQLHRIPMLALISVKETTLEKCVYVAEDTVRALQEMEFLFVDPEELGQIVERIRDEEKMAVTAEAPLVLSAAQFAGAIPAADAVPAGKQSQQWTAPATQDNNKKKEVSLAEMYRVITSELG
jgi:hypothetical protein